MLVERDFLKNLYADLCIFFNSADFSLKPLHGGASFRKYYKICFSQPFYFPSGTIILMIIPKNHLDIFDDYLTIGYYLKHRDINIPQIFEINRDKGWIFTAPGSGQLVSDYWNQNHQNSESLYTGLVDLLIEIQTKAVLEKKCPAFNRFFDKDKFQYEFQFHVQEQLIGYFFNYSFTRNEAVQYKLFTEEISETLHSEMPLFVHRDFQSSNIFYDPRNPDNPFQIIDFQDARSGIPVYDLVSLLWDSYINLSQNLRKKLVDTYYKRQKQVSDVYTEKEYRRMIHYTIIQRKLHDAGAFAYCRRSQGNVKYVPYIIAAIQTALEAMKPFKQFTIISSVFKRLVAANSG